MTKIQTLAFSFFIASFSLLPRAFGQVIVPYTFSPGSSIQSSQANANFSAVASEINAHENATNPHQTTLSQILALGNSCGATPINFNGTQGVGFRAENLASDPTPGSAGRFFINTTTHLLKFDDGSTIQTIGGSGSNNLSSVLNSGNSAGSFNIDLNENQLLHARAENQTSDPSSGNAGRLYYNTSTHALMVDSGAAWTAIGGSQGLASVLGVSNSAGSSNIDFNQHQAKSMALDNLSADPGSPVAGQVWYSSTSHIPKFFNGTSSLAVGNTNTLAQTLSLGNSAGSTPIDFNGQQAQHMVLWNNAGSPGTGTPGYVWFDSTAGQVAYETSGSNHYVCSVDDAQSLTNKTISGASNTLTNIQDSSLSSNVALLSATKTVSGSWTFSSAPKAGAIKNTTGDSISMPTGTGNDSFVYQNAAQILSGKTLNAPIFSGNPNFAENQAFSFRAENVASLPSAGNAGRLVWNIGGQSLAVDSGSSWVSIAGSPVVTWSVALANGNSAGTTNPDFNLNQALNMRLENVAPTPLPGSAGRVDFNTISTFPEYDNGTVMKTFADTDSTQTLSNKTIIKSLATASATGAIPQGQFFTVATCASACTLTLPALASVVGANQAVFYDVKVTGAGVVTVAGNGADTIDGAGSAVLKFTNSELTLAASNTGWMVR